MKPNTIRMRQSQLLLCVVLVALVTQPTTMEENSWLPLFCQAEQTVGLHDFAEEDEQFEERYELIRFFESKFELRENKTFNELMGQEDGRYYLSMKAHDSLEISEFTCDSVRGRNGQEGLSCRNTPPSEIIMINKSTLRFTRSAVGAWTFFTPSDHDTGASLFVEYGQCETSQASDEPH